MKLHVISSSSAGNCYVLESEASALVIECGASPETMFARTGIDARKFVGAVVTHEHGDHAAHIGKYADRQSTSTLRGETLAACHTTKRTGRTLCGRCSPSRSAISSSGRST